MRRPFTRALWSHLDEISEALKAGAVESFSEFISGLIGGWDPLDGNATS